jgi:hypothetical protein
MRAIALLCALCALGGLVTGVLTNKADAADATPKPDSRAESTTDIARLQRVTWHWQHVMGVRRTASSFSALRSIDPAYRRWVRELWRRRAQRVRTQAATWMVGRIRHYRSEIEYWQQVMGAGPLRQTASAGGRERTFLRWRSLARAVLRQAQHPPYASAWLCIHRYEGAWTDGGGPYYGGLQMDLGFQQHYGGYLLQRKGTAGHWTPLEQMWVAARAYRSGRGFYPWPNTARACGLL